ncbi:MAG: diguanylate cyclase [Pseudomonadota bacterium]
MTPNPKAPGATQQGDADTQLVSVLLQENDRLQTALNAERQKVELFLSVFNCIPDALVLADSNRKMQLVNPAAEKLFGYSVGDVTGHATAMLYESEADFHAQGSARFNLSAKEKREPYMQRYRRKDGTTFSGETLGTSLRSADGDFLGFLGAIRDVTARELAASEIIENERLLSLVTDALPELVTYYDTEKVLRFVNTTGERWYHRPRQELIGMPLCAVIGEAASLAIEPWVQQALNGREVRQRAEVTYPDGITRSVELSYTPDVAPNGEVLGFVALVVDVTAHRNIEKELIASQTRFLDAIDAMPDGFAYYDAEDRLQIFNKQYQSIFAKSGDAIAVGKTFEEILRAGVACGQYEEAVGREEEWIEHRLSVHAAPGAPVEQKLWGGRWIRIEECKTADGGTVGIRVDVTDAKHREAELERLSVTDALTGLSNRRAFLTSLGEAHERVQTNGNILSVLLLDVDYFKSINDTYGHATGDEVLVRIAELISGELRGKDQSCRYGGEEFAVLLPDTSIGGAFAMAQRIREAIESAEFRSGQLRFNITASIGVTQLDGRDKKYELALARADEALYRAKRHGRNRVDAELVPLHVLSATIGQDGREQPVSAE